jgi:hypothetical protein
MEATWDFYLLNRNEPPACYVSNIPDKDRHIWAMRCADKVSDGSDADAFIMVRSDNYGLPSVSSLLRSFRQPRERIWTRG